MNVLSLGLAIMPGPKILGDALHTVDLGACPDVVKKHALDAMRVEYQLWQTQLEAAPLMRRTALLSECSNRFIWGSRGVEEQCYSSKTIESTGLFFCSSWLLSKHIEKCERKHIEKCERLGTHFCIYNKSNCNGEETPTMVLTSLDRHGAVVPGPVAQAAADCVNQQMLDSRQRVAL